MEFKSGQHIHIVGIGGSGMSSIARILLERGFTVSGSDRTLNSLTDALARDGAIIYQGHAAEQIKNADLLLISSAIYHNPEVIAAEELDLPVYKRKDILASLMRQQQVIAVAGTHGKTTTTALITHLLQTCGLDPSYIVGGIMGNTGTNAGVGHGRAFVIEADEYDNMYHGLWPNIALITSIEYDHPDFFASKLELMQSFNDFAARLRHSEDVLLVCADHDQPMRLYHDRQAAGGGSHTYGLSSNAHYRGENIRIEAGYTVFDVSWAVWTDRDGEPTKYMSLGTVRSPLLGQHNVQNALGALCVANRFCNLPFDQVAAALTEFKGTERRFELRGEIDGLTVIDDYAHHPTAIRATLQGARSRYPNHQLCAVWQPHTYSRTEQLLDDYATAFNDADQVIVTEIYAAREVSPANGFNGSQVAQRLQHPRTYFAASFDQAVDQLVRSLARPAVIVIMSAGDAPQIGELLFNQLQT
ncbi:MAG: UDP-N-acetylmuramate--L-alanine ligase [Anaerolineae bacterium]|jgi:UDP-N-acetylmuramate--alanine ligase|nr:UDP-N-acetylmuramate--L-alanine ligase [Anaerolineae bacterium]